MRVAVGVAKNGLSGSSMILVLVLAEGGGNGGTRCGIEGPEGKIDANGVQEGSATGRGRGGENGFTFAASGSGSRSRSCTTDLVRVIITEVGSARSVLVLGLVRRGGVNGTVVAAFVIATFSALLSAFHFLYLSTGRDQS